MQYIIDDFMRTELQLKGLIKEVYAIIYNASQYNGNLKLANLVELTSYSEDEILAVLTTLYQRELISEDTLAKYQSKSKPEEFKPFNASPKPQVKVSKAVLGLHKEIMRIEPDMDIQNAMIIWVDTLAQLKKTVTSAQLNLAHTELYSLSKGDKALMLKLLTSATQAGYRCFAWCAEAKQASSLLHNNQQNVLSGEELFNKTKSRLHTDTTNKRSY